MKNFALFSALGVSVLLTPLLTIPVSAEILTMYSDNGIPPTPPSTVIVYGCSLTFPQVCTGGPTEGFNGNATDLVPPEGYTSWKTTSTFSSASEYAGWGIAYDSPQDLTRFWPSGELRFWIYSTTPNVQLDIKQSAGVPAMPTLTLSPPINQWVYEHIKLSQFILLQSSMSSIINPFLFTSVGGPATFYVDDVRYVDSVVSPIFNVSLCNASNNACGVSQITWSGAMAASSWALADQYIQLTVDPNTTSWGVQIYTDNTNSSPRYTGSISSTTPGGGMVDTSSTSVVLPMAWEAVATSSPTLAAQEPNSCSTGNGLGCLWFYLQDRAVFGLGNPNVVNGAPYVTAKSNYGIHYAQGTIFNDPAEFGAAVPPNDIYLEANFGLAPAGRTYKTTALIVEYYTP